MKLLWICGIPGLLLVVACVRGGDRSDRPIEKSAGSGAMFSVAGSPPGRSPAVAAGVAGDADTPLTPSQYVFLHQSRDEVTPVVELPNRGDAVRNRRK